MPFLRNCRRNPFARLLLFYMAGIASAPVLKGLTGGIWLLLALTTLTGILFLPAFMKSGFQTGWKTGIFFFLLLFSMGVGTFSADALMAENAATLPADRDIYRVRILSIPDKGTGYTRSIAKVLYARSNEDLRMKIRLYFTAANKTFPAPGEEILVHTSLMSVAPPGNPNEFNYAAYLATRHIYRQAYAGPGEWKSCGLVRNSVPAISCRFRNTLMRCYKKSSLDPGYVALLTALTLGYREDVDAATEAAFSRAGVMHIMALSGFNVGMIASVILFVAGGFRKNRKPATAGWLLTLLVVWLFVLVTGLSPSVTRAAVMISIGLSGLVARQRVNTANVLFASAFIMLAISPCMLFDAGFQLSFAAVGGILMSETLQLRTMFARFPLFAKVWQLFILSCAAQLATLPFTLHYFHQFPLYFWLTNLYVVPLVSVIICVGMLFLILSWWGVAVAALGKVLGLLLKTLVFSVSLPEHLPYSLIDRIYITPGQAVCLALLVIFIAAFLTGRKLVMLHFMLAVLLLFQGMGIFRHLRNERQKLFMVASVRHTTALLFANGRHSCLLLDPRLPPENNAISYALGGFLLARGLHPEFFGADTAGSLSSKNDPIPGLTYRTGWRGSNVLIGYNGMKIILLRDGNIARYKADNQIHVDYLVVSKGMKLPPDKVLHDIFPGTVILDASVPSWQQKSWLATLASRGITCYTVPASGAFLTE